MPDTVGYAVPDEYAALITMLRNRVPNIDKAILSVHCHNDLGLAVANSLAAVAAGRVGSNARSTGWASAPVTRRWRRSSWRCARATITCRFIPASRPRTSCGRATGLGDHRFVVQPNKAIVGANAFAHDPESSGWHAEARWHLRDHDPESVGLSKSNLVLGKHSGRHAFREKLRELSYELGDNALEDAFHRFKELADRKKEVFDEDIVALVDDELVRAHDRIKLVSLDVACGTRSARASSARRRRRASVVRVRRRRTGGFGVQVHQATVRDRCPPEVIPSSCGDRWHRRASRSDGAT